MFEGNEQEQDYTVEDLLTALNIDVPEEKDESDAEGVTSEEGAESGTDAKPDEEAKEDEASEDTSIKEDPKANAAFAQMRVKNKELEKTLQNIAELIGVKSNDSDVVLSSLKSVITNAKAKQAGVPPELLQRLERLEDIETQYNQRQFQDNAYAGFQQIKDRFGLTNAEVTAFAEQLAGEGVNPFTQNVDVFNEYRLRNFDKLIEDATNKGIQKEAERAAKAMNSGSTPGKKDGTPPPEPEKIDTVEGLTKYLATKLN